MKKNPKASVIIPVYNGEKTLKQCLESVLNQTYKNYEIILVDNNSTDKTKKIIEAFQNKSEKIKYVFEPKIRRGTARNTGEKKAKGKIVLMTDSDCIVPKNWVKEMIEAITKDNFDGVQGIKIDTKETYFINKNIKNSKKTVGKTIKRIDAANFAIKKSVLKEVGYTNPSIFRAYDTELMIRLQKKNKKIKFIKGGLVKHFNNKNFSSIFRKYYESGFWHFKITRAHKKFLKNTNFLIETNQTLWTFFKFFPGIIQTIMKYGFKTGYYDFTRGLAWRIGLIEGWIRK